MEPAPAPAPAPDQLKAVRAAVPNDVPEETARRFLAAASGDVRRATAALALHRASFRAPSVADICHELRLRYLMPVPGGADAEGRPLAVLCPREFDALVSSPAAAALLAAWVHAHLLHTEMTGDAMSWRDGGVAAFTWVVDLGGFGRKGYSDARQAVRAVQDVLLAHFPRLTGLVFVVNCPPLFWAAWGVARHFVSADTKGRVSLARAGSSEELAAVIDARNLALCRDVMTGAGSGALIESLLRRKAAAEDVDLPAPRAPGEEVQLASFAWSATSAADALASAPDDALTSGYVYKKGGGGTWGSNRWQKKLFVLVPAGSIISSQDGESEEPVLLYYDDDKASKPNRVIEISDPASHVDGKVHPRMTADVLNGRNYRFDVTVSGRTFELCCAAPQEREVWLDAFRANSVQTSGADLSVGSPRR